MRRWFDVSRSSSLVVVAVALTAGGCAHQVAITSNVPEAEVRVDGNPLGTVKDGATFTESWGASRVYDIEVKAPRHRVGRLEVKPSEVDSWGALAMISSLGGCGVSTCIAPFSLIALLNISGDPASVVPRDKDGNIDLAEAGNVAALWAAAGAVYGCTGYSLWALAGSQRLPDEIFVDLEPEAGVGEEGVPPPPPPPASASLLPAP